MKELIFRGKLRKGADRARVVAALAKRFKRSPREIEQRLFRGGPTRIATVETHADALRYVAAFARLGAVLEIRDAAAKGAGPSSAATRLVERVRQRLVQVAAAVAVLVAVGAASAWYLAPVWRAGEQSEAELAAARALATDDLLFLAHLDVRRAARLEQRLVGPLDPGALLGDEDDPLTSLARSGIDLRRQVEDAVFAGYVDDKGLETAVVLIGEFDPQRVRRWIESRYQVVQYFNSNDTVHFRPVLKNECPSDSLYAARLASNRIVLSTPRRLPELARRVWAGARADVPLAQWDRLTGQQVATLGFFAPDRLADAAGGPARMILAGAAQAHAPAETVFFGLEPTLLPPGVMLSGEIVSANTDYLEQTRQGLQGFIDRGLEQAGQGWPELVALYERAGFERSGNTLRGHLRLDTDLDDELGTLFNAVIADLFSFGVKGGGQQEEAVVEDPLRFRDVGVDAIGPFTPADDAEAFAWHRGPVALAVEATSWNDGRHQVELGIEARGLPNAGDINTGLRFRVEDVIDRNGESLLATPECGPDDNRAWTKASRRAAGSTFVDGEMRRYRRTLGSHVLTLADGASAADISRIRGTVEYRLPARLEIRKLDAPLGGKVVEQAGVRLRFQPGGPQELAYRYSGDRDRLLAVRGLNGSGQVLRQSGSFRGDQLFGSGGYASVSYQGEVASAEVVIAREFEPQRYRFELDGGLPTIRGDARQPAPLPALAPKGALERTLDGEPPAVDFEWNPPQATRAVGSLLIALERIQVAPGFGLFGSIGLYTPPDLPLAHDLNGATLHLDSIVGPGGDTVAAGESQSFALRPAGAYWLNGEYTVPPDRPWLTGSTGFQQPDYAGAMPAAIEGRVGLRAVTRTETTALSARVGNRKRGDVFDFNVTRWEGGDTGTITLEATGLVERIVSVTARDADRRRVDTGTRLQRRDGQSRVILQVSRWPRFIHVVYATASERREFDFRIEPPG